MNGSDRIGLEKLKLNNALELDESMDGINHLEAKVRNGYMEAHCGRMVR